jgi:GDP-L-fucose synthase|tara:strand:+ start:1999 stop:2931 length:933 start_codon:yes stop_codon:yes gene_type:complete
MDISKKVYVAGHRGLVGSAIVKVLQKKGFKNIVTRTRNELDLLDQKAVSEFFESERPAYVFDAAAKVGGIYANDTYSADFIYENIQIQNNLIHSAWQFEVENFLFLGSVCIYPKFAEVPVKEESLLTGHLEPTNDAYAIAKISGIKMLQAYHKQYGMKGVCLMPSNLYGPGDNFHPDNGHVIPAMIRKFEDSMGSEVTFWGDGSPKREFLYSEDLADACVFAIDKFENGELINVGSGENISIKDLANKVASVVRYNGEIGWDTSRPNGTPNRPLDNSKITDLGWKPKHTLSEGLRKTYEWYVTETYLETI